MFVFLVFELLSQWLAIILARISRVSRVLRNPKPNCVDQRDTITEPAGQRPISTPSWVRIWNH